MQKSDFLKYYAPIKKFYMIKHKLSPSKIDLLLFLYSEKYFDSNRYEEFNRLFSFDKNRMSNLLRDDWVRVFRKGKRFELKTIYCLSPKSINMIESMYRKIEGEEIPTEPYHNALFKKNVPYTHKVYADFIKSLNTLRRSVKKTKHNNLEGAYN